MSSAQEQKVPFIFFKCSDATPDIRLLKEYSARHVNTVETLASTKPNQLIDHIGVAGSGLIVFEARTKEDVTAVLDILAKLTPLLKSNLVKVVGYCHIDNDKIETLLRKKGCSDLLIPGLSVKGLTYKCDQWFKVIRLSIAKHNVASTVETKNIIAKSVAHTESTQKSSEVQVQFIEAMNQPGDYWALPKKWTIKKNFNNYAFEMIGFPPSQGAWKERSPQQWQFQLRPGSDATKYFSEHEVWVFHGKRPEFSWESYTWHFSSENPRLELESGGMMFARLRINEQQVAVVCQNGEEEGRITSAIKDILQVEVKFHSQENIKSQGKDTKTFEHTKAESSWKTDTVTKSSSRPALKPQPKSNVFPIRDEAEDLLVKLKPVGLEIQLYDPVIKSLTPLIFLDQFDQTLICQRTDGKTADGEKLYLRIKFYTGAKKHELVCEVKCLDVDYAVEPPVITLDVSKVPSELLNDLLYTMQIRQVSASQFLNMAKGL